MLPAKKMELVLGTIGPAPNPVRWDGNGGTRPG